MATAHEKLAASLEALRGLQREGARVFQSRDLKRGDRERLVKNGFLQPVLKGWFISATPGARAGDATPWFSSFWEFCRKYSDKRFGQDWYLSAEQSLRLHTENNAVPSQVVVYSSRGTNHQLELPHSTSIYDLREGKPPPDGDLTVRDGLRLFSLEASLVRIPASFYVRNHVDVEVALATVQEPSSLLARLLDGGHAVVAGRLAGAFRRIGRAGVADEIVSTMRIADHDVRESDPFAPERVVEIRSSSPIIGRLEAMWSSARAEVLAVEFPSPGGAGSRDEYLQQLDNVYHHDAYHSLSIEGYEVTLELIQRVASGDWKPELDEDHRRDRDALAARGYWLAFQRVRETAAAALVAPERVGEIVRATHRDWYRDLFTPQLTAGLLEPGQLAGYRSNPVYLRGSRHVPPRWEILGDAMSALFDLIERESEPRVRAVLGHWLLGYVHPFSDGNGRIARFLMNTLLAAGGHRWTVIRVSERAGYLSALEEASVGGTLQPFAEFVAAQVAWSMSEQALSS